MTAADAPHQGPCFAIIDYDTQIKGVPPAEAEMRRDLRVSPPAVHEMVEASGRRGFIARGPGKPRSIRRLPTRAGLPDPG